MQPASLCTSLVGLQVWGLIKIKMNLQAVTPGSCMQSVFAQSFPQMPVRDKEGNGSKKLLLLIKKITSERDSIVFVTGMFFVFFYLNAKMLLGLPVILTFNLASSIFSKLRKYLEFLVVII